MKKLFLLVSVFSFLNVQSQIVLDNTAPYDNTTYLIDNVLLGGGIVGSNHSFIGDSNQIGFFNGVNSNLGIDSGIVLSTGLIADIVGPNNSAGSFTSLSPFPYLPGDPTLDSILYDIYLNTVPLPFSPDSTKEAAVLEFDFVPTSDTLSFKYIFASEEYLEFVSSFNDIFGFFLTGPNPTGGNYVNENLAIVPGTVNTPVSIFNVNDVVNSAYYVDNGDGFTSPQNTDPTVIQFDGFTTPLTAVAAVNCGDTYHIKIVVADVNDGAYESGVFLEAGSFFSPSLAIVDNLGIDSTIMSIPCNSTIKLSANGGTGATYDWYDSTATLISTDSFLIVGPGIYWVEASSSGCPVISDTLRVVADDSPSFDLGLDYNIPCNTKALLNPLVIGGLGSLFYQYSWNTGSDSSSIIVPEGSYILDVDDGTGCNFKDTIIITEDTIPHVTISGGGSICDDGTTTNITFTFNGLLPWDLIYTNGADSITKENISASIYTVPTLLAGLYEIVLADDINDCIAVAFGNKVEVFVNPMPTAVISPSEITIYEGETINLIVGEYQLYEWYNAEDNLLSVYSELSVTDSGSFYVLVTDENNCKDFSENAIVHTVPRTDIYIPTAFTPNGDDNNELFVIQGNYINSFNIKIYNKWGDELFVSDTMYKYWDGTFGNKKVQQGTYFYVVEVIGEDENLFKKSGVIEVLY